MARVFVGDQEKTTEIIKRAITHNGYSFVDILQPCVTFNKINTWKWFKENTYYLTDSHKANNKVEAFKQATKKGKIPLGIFYTTKKPTFEENLPVYKINKDPLYMREAKLDKLKELDLI